MEKKEQEQFKNVLIEERLKMMNILSKTSSLLILVLVPLLVALLGLIYVINPESERPYGFEKEPIQRTIKAIIINGGNLDIIKHTYSNRNIKGKNFREDLLGIDKDKYYRYDYPLSGILNDLLKN